jgi:hypothetical protein
MFMNYDHDSVKNIDYHSTIRNLYYYLSCASNNFTREIEVKRSDANSILGTKRLIHQSL